MEKQNLIPAEYVSLLVGSLCVSEPTNMPSSCFEPYFIYELDASFLGTSRRI